MAHATCDANLDNVEVTTPVYGVSPRNEAKAPSWLTRRPALSGRMQQVLIHGDPLDDYQPIGSKSPKADHGHAITAAVATACARSGWTRLDLHYAIFQSTARAGQHARDIARHSGHDRAAAYLDRVWERATALVAESGISSRQDSIADLIALGDRISYSYWGGTARGTDLRVLTAHWKIAKRAGGRLHTASYREIAESAGCALNTAFTATRRLVRDGWLRQVNSGTREHGSAWMLLDGLSHGGNSPRGRQAGGASSVPSVRNGELDAEVIEKLMGLDAFAHRGLGTSSMKILAALHLSDSQTVRELTESAAVSSATAYRHLVRLAEHELAAKIGEVWTLTTTAKEALAGPWEGWDEVANSVGTYGASWRRQQLHDDQRATWYGQTLPRLRERRMPDVRPVRGDEVPAAMRWGSQVVDPVTGEVLEGFAVASDGRLIMIQDEPDYDELLRRSREAELAYAA